MVLLKDFRVCFTPEIHHFNWQMWCKSHVAATSLLLLLVDLNLERRDSFLAIPSAAASAAIIAVGCSILLRFHCYTDTHSTALDICSHRQLTRWMLPTCSVMCDFFMWQEPEPMLRKTTMKMCSKRYNNDFESLHLRKMTHWWLWLIDGCEKNGSSRLIRGHQMCLL